MGKRIGQVELAVRNDGKISAVRHRFIEDVGAYLRLPEPSALFRVQGNLNGAYDIRVIEAHYTVIFTNRPPTGLNRGYSEPQFYFALERAVDEAARRLGVDSLEFRLRDLIREFPVENNRDEFLRDGHRRPLSPSRTTRRWLRRWSPSTGGGLRRRRGAERSWFVLLLSWSLRPRHGQSP